MRRVVPAAVLAAVLGTASCGLLGGGDEAGGAEVPRSEGAAAAEDSEGSTSGGERVVGTVEASVQDRHPQGHLLSAGSVEVRERSIAVEVSLVNGSTRDIQMNSGRLWLVDDLGSTYEFSPPSQNEDLEVGPGAELTGTLVFLGVLDPEATSLTMLANVDDPTEVVDLEARDNQSRYPELVLDGLPLP